MTEVNSTILNILFQNFDVVLIGKKKKAIFLDGRFYFATDWTYTTHGSMANKEIYDVTKIFRASHYNGDAFRFLHNDHESTYNMILIYEKKKTCSCCGQTLSGEE
jgi:hypothetical protein